MKKVSITLIASTLVLIIVISSCKKEECHECHYDDNGGEVELGSYCGDDLEEIEANGYVDSNGDNHEVHCHEH